MSSSGGGQQHEPMSFEAMERALALLDDEIAKKPGIFVRYRLHPFPNVATAEDYAIEFKHIVFGVAEKCSYAKDWLNQDLEMFVHRDRRASLFLESLQQNIVIYKGNNLEIYAGALHWALERKMRRVAHARDRRIDKNVDIPDAAALIRHMSPPISADYIRNLNFNGFEPKPTDEAIKQVADYYVQKYNEVGITGI